MLGYNRRVEPFPEQREVNPLDLKPLFHLGGYGHAHLLGGDVVYLILLHQRLEAQFLQLLKEELDAKVSRVIANQRF